MSRAEHHTFMKQAIELAKKARGFTSPNPMVGAVVVKEGRVVGRGYHRAAGMPHAEVEALDDAGSNARGADLYVNLEPCNHHGRTPPCTEAVIAAGIARIFVAMKDPNPDVTGNGCKHLALHGVQVFTGILEDEAKRLNEVFIKFVTRKKPFVLLKCATTLDGRIAASSGDSKWITNEISRRHVHLLRHYFDGIMVGKNTVLSDNPMLTSRLGKKKVRHPVRIVLDSACSIPEDANVFNLAGGLRTIVVTAGSPGKNAKKERLIRKGVEFIEVPRIEGLLDLESTMDQLAGMEITSVLIEGGGRLAHSAIKSGIVDKINIFFAPKIMGGDDGIPIFAGPGAETMAQCINLKEIRTRRFGDDIMVEGRF